MGYVEELIKWTEGQVPRLLSFIISIVISLLIVLIGHKIIKLLLKRVRQNLNDTNADEGVGKFLLSILKIACYVILFVIAARRIGLETSSVIAVIGSAGLAIGLSLQGSLANFAGGVLLLTTKPFVLGDTIVVGDLEGVVEGIDIIYTTLVTFDNRKIVLPNGKLANSEIINVTSKQERRLDLTVPVRYSEDIKKVKEFLESMLNRHELFMKERSVSIFIHSFEASSILIGFRIWVTTEQYWQLRCELMEQVKEEFEANEILIPYEQMKIEIVKD